MAKKPLGKDKFGVQKVMRTGDYFADSLGQFALNSMSGLIGQLTYFYTDKVGMAAGAVATVLLICKIVDAFTDVIMGNIVDHTAPGKEKYRPWFLRMAIPAAIILLMLFTVPAAPAPLQLGYMFITNILLSAIVYTAIAIPYTALIVVRTNSQEERGKMGIWRAAAGYVSGMIIALAIIPITNLLGGDQGAWIKFSIGFAILIALALILCYVRAKEQPVEIGAESAKKMEVEEEEPVPFKEALKNLFQNKYWVMILIMGVMSNVSYGISGASGVYYCKWIYGDDNLVGILGAVGMIPTIVGFVAVGPMVKRLGVTKTLKVSFFVGMVATAVRIMNPTNFVFNTVLGCFASFANIPMMCLLGVMTAMAIDYNEFKYGRKMVGTSQAAAGFGGKIGSGLGASVVGWCLGIAGYNAAAEVASTTVRIAIYTFGIYIPLILFVIMFVITLRFDLEAKLPAMREEIEVRKKYKNE
ncbi:glycoside-pentoside-hexuronide (GPH):cation symporter [Lachnospiraceae bacterium OttesenSCG-928-D06]|nr:glycoside-pentoside-hexuronide (GPH):cation symporter [Lachnospiraceae bacterium OttesenSCG-928-D06]